MSDIVIQNNWDFLKAYTDARIALGRTGHSLPTAKLLEFQLAHAQAKDAVYSILDVPLLENEIARLGLTSVVLDSQVTDRGMYLKRPDLGRRLRNESFETIQHCKTNTSLPFDYDLCICAVDGLSAQAIQTNLFPFLSEFIPSAKKEQWSIAPIAIVNQGRVAIGDDIGSQFNAEIVIVLIGERPGLSSPDSMGIYLTYQPKTGFTDEKRNCISNIRPKGLAYNKAADALFYLIKASKSLKLSGVNLKEDTLIANK